MPAKAGQVVVEIVAGGSAKFIADVASSEAKLRSFGATGVSETKATTAGIKAMEGGFANSNRAAASFITTVLGGGQAMQAIFPLVGGLAFAGMLVTVGEKVYDFFKKIQEAPEKAAGAFSALGASLRMQNSELDLQNAKLEHEISILQGKQPNGLLVALAEARVESDKLSKSLEKNIEDLYKLLKEQDLGWFAKLTSGLSGTGDIQKLLGGLTGSGGYMASLRDINNREDASLGAINPKDKNAQYLKNDAANEASAQRGAILNDISAAFDKAIGEARERSKDTQYMDEQTGRMETAPGSDTAKAQVENLLKAKADVQEMIRNMNSMNRNTSDKETKDAAEEAEKARKKLEEQLKKEAAIRKELEDKVGRAQAGELTGLMKINAEEKENLRQLAEKDASVKKFVDAGGFGSGAPVPYNAGLVHAETVAKTEGLNKKHDQEGSEIDTEIGLRDKKKLEEGLKEWQKDFDKLNEEIAKAAAKHAEAMLKARDEATKQDAQHQSKMIGLTSSRSDPMGTLAKQQAVDAAAIETEYQAKIKLKTTDQEVAKLERDTALQKLKDLHDEAAVEHDFFQQMANNAKSAKQIGQDTLTSAIDQTSDALAKLFTGQKVNFAKMIQGMGESMIKESLKSLIQRGLGAMAPKKPIDIWAVHPHVWIDNPSQATGGQQPQPQQPQQPAGGKAGGILQTIGGFLRMFGGGMSGTGGGSSGGGDGLTPNVTSSIDFGGGMASGGNVDPGVAYDIGEAGTERFVPRTAGTIIPHGAMGGTNFNIDARGADLGAHNRIARAMESTHNLAVANSIHANVERSKRVPQRSS
jgi:hypothetical protein